MIQKVRFDEKEHRYYLGDREYVSVTKLISDFGLSDFSRVSESVLEVAAPFGKAVHKLTRLYDEDNIGKFDKKLQPWLDAWLKFRRENCISNFEVIEKPMISKTWMFAGTCDRYGNNILWDIKTGAESPWHSIQTAMYSILIEENLREKVKKRYCIYLKKNSYKVVEHKNKSDISIGKSMVSILSWKNEKGVKW